MTKKDQIRKEVKEFYKKVSTGEEKTSITADELYRSLGYDETELALLPEEVKLGLSCGNPLENLIVKQGETLLDLGSGTGMDVFLARIKFPEGGVFYGVDVLEEMVEKARNVAEKKGFERVEFRQGTLVDLPFQENTMDHVISNCVINLEPDKQSVYKEIYRVLKPGGTCILSDVILKKELSKELREAKNLYGT
ncbi:MAG: methyltransferase domain-containing protein [Tissierellia bacterium]|nr:methyltransferase domain-containing protein [Tissierellia bacterium]